MQTAFNLGVALANWGAGNGEAFPNSLVGATALTRHRAYTIVSGGKSDEGSRVIVCRDGDGMVRDLYPSWIVAVHPAEVRS